MERFEFTKEKVCAMQRVSKDIFNGTRIDSYEDIIRDELVYQITSFVYANTSEERDLIYYCERPTFLDWLFRRRKKVVFKLKVKDLLLEKPKYENTLRTYNIERVVTQHQNKHE